MLANMTSLMIGRAFFLLPTSETPTQRTAGEPPVGDPPAAGSTQSAVSNPMLAPTLRQPAVVAPVARRAVGPRSARLVRVGTGGGDVFSIGDGTAMIGRDRESDVVVSGAAVSRRHSIVRRSMRGYVVTDVSRNGTYLNGRRVRGARVLRNGDVLRIGEEEFRFEVDRPTPYAGVAVAAALNARFAQLWNAARLADITRQVATALRLRTESELSRLRNVAGVVWTDAAKTFWMIWARVRRAWRVQRRTRSGARDLTH
jgi:hypothetical protein